MLQVNCWNINTTINSCRNLSLPDWSVLVHWRTVRWTNAERIDAQILRVYNKRLDDEVGICKNFSSPSCFFMASCRLLWGNQHWVLPPSSISRVIRPGQSVHDCGGPDDCFGKLRRFGFGKWLQWQSFLELKIWWGNFVSLVMWFSFSRKSNIGICINFWFFSLAVEQSFYSFCGK